MEKSQMFNNAMANLDFAVNPRELARLILQVKN